MNVAIDPKWKDN